MVTVSSPQQSEADFAPRRPATIGALDARLSVWGQAARDAVGRRADALVQGSLLYVEKVGRNAEALHRPEVDSGAALLDVSYESLVELSASLLPPAVVQACRLLWVDPDRLRERLNQALAPATEAARAEVRRRQALYRRRARLWQNDQSRLNRLRDEIESMRVPRCAPAAPELIARGLLERHKEELEAAPEGRLSVKPGSMARWLSELDARIAEVKANPASGIPLAAPALEDDNADELDAV